MELEIREEFFKLIPALSSEEASNLIQSLQKEGCRDSIVIWNGIIVDGHNRYAICKKYGIKFEVVEMDFEDKYDAMIWMINTQFARRNLPIEYRLDLAIKIKELEAEQAKARQLASLKQNVENEASHDANGAKGKTLAKVAQKAGTSTRTAERYDSVMRKGTEEQKDAVRSGKKKIGTVYKEIQAQENPTEEELIQKDIGELFQEKFKSKYLTDNKVRYLFLYDKDFKKTEGFVEAISKVYATQIILRLLE